MAIFFALLNRTDKQFNAIDNIQKYYEEPLFFKKKMQPYSVIERNDVYYLRQKGLAVRILFMTIIIIHLFKVYIINQLAIIFIALL